MLKIKRRITRAYFNIARSHYAPLVQRLSILISVDNIQIEELKSRADEELLKCMICYNGNGSLITFFYSRLTGIFRHLRDKENRAKRILKMPTDSMSNIAGPDYDTDFSMTVQECLECLDNEERKIIIELFFREKSMREVSSDQGMVASTICRIKTRAIKKMQRKCGVKQE